MADEPVEIGEDEPQVLSLQTEEHHLRVSATSQVQELALAVCHAIYERGSVTLRAIGAGAVNQAIKSVAIARGMTATKGIDLVCRPGFADVTIKGETYSAITLLVYQT